MLRETLFGKAVITMHANKARREQVSANVPLLFFTIEGRKMWWHNGMVGVGWDMAAHVLVGAMAMVKTARFVAYMESPLEASYLGG